MPGQGESGRWPISEAHARLGQAMKRTRHAQGLSTRQIPGFVTGHISNVENGYTPPSPELVEKYIELGGNGVELRSLYKQMLAASEAAGRLRRQRATPAPSETLAPQSVEEVGSHEEVQRHYVTDTDQVTYIFNGDGVIEDVQHSIALRALTPNVRLYYAGHSYAADRRPGVLSAEAGTGATLVATPESSTGALQSYFLLDRSLSPADPEPYMLSFRIHVKSRVRARPSLTFHNGTGGVHRVILHALFGRPALPQRIWWFAAPDVIDAERGQPDREFAVNSDGHYFKDFDNLVPSWCYGFTWIW